MGSTEKLRDRWRKHHRWDEIIFVEGAYIEWEYCNEEDLRDREREIISEIKYLMNGTAVKSVAEIAEDMREYYRLRDETNRYYAEGGGRSGMTNNLSIDPTNT